MRRNAGRHLVVLAAAVGLALAGLTVWSVAQQSRALHDRDVADLRNAASRAAAERVAALRGDLVRTFVAAGLAWQWGKVEGLGWWLEGRRPWSLAVLRGTEDHWTTFPRSETSQPPAEIQQAMRALDSQSQPAEEEALSFAVARARTSEPLVVVIGRLAPAAQLALAAPLSDLLARYWSDAADIPWRVVLPGKWPARDELCQLGAPFGDAVLVPSPDTARRFAAAARRREALVVATAVGAAGAWGIVIWMMLRAVARERELVRLQRRFVADVSHELKTPLTMIRLLAETLQDGRVRDPERVRTYYDTITRESERLSVLLDGILDFSRIESGRQRPELVDCDVAEVARQAWALFEPQLAAEGFERRIEIAPDLPTIRADAAALQQVFVNLLQNAYRYAGDGKYVRLAVAREGYLIVITVEDHGIGMTPGQLARLGDSFFRAEDTRVRKTRGTGLGLALVDHTIRAHGGKLEAQSRPGRGSTFTVWIPFEPTEGQASTT